MQHAAELKEARAALEGAVTISKLAANVRTPKAMLFPAACQTRFLRITRHSRYAMHRSLHHRLWQRLYRCTTNVLKCLHLQTHGSSPHCKCSPPPVFARQGHSDRSLVKCSMICM